jgi:hypothetical protein
MASNAAFPRVTTLMAKQAIDRAIAELGGYQAVADRLRTTPASLMMRRNRDAGSRNRLLALLRSLSP